jgi:hypothetical protein
MEAGGRADESGPLLEGGAASKLRIFQILDGGKVLVDERGVGQRPEVFGGLQFGRIGWEEEQVDVVGDPQPDARVPARPIEHEHNLLGGTGSRLTRKLGQLDFKDGNAHGRGQMKDGPTGGGMHKTDQVAPREAVLHGGNRTLTDRRPDAPQQRFEPDAMLIGGPQLHLGVGEGGRHRLQQRPYFFLKLSCCSASASA